MKGNSKDREFDKFRESFSGTSVSVTMESEWDEISSSFPNSTTEIYTYKKNSDTILSVTVTYTDAGKHTVMSVLKERA